MSEVKNILLVGVGGQGTITAAKLLTLGLMEAGYDVKMSEIHGMSQRGGSVSSQVRYGTEVQSPVIEKGTADVIVAFEKMEAMRYLDYLKLNGKMIVNETEIWPMPVIIGNADYPENIMSALTEKVSVHSMDAGKMAMEMGNTRITNVILLGTVIKAMGLDKLNWDAIIEQNVKPQFVELNKAALRKGLLYKEV